MMKSVATFKADVTMNMMKFFLASAGVRGTTVKSPATHNIDDAVGNYNKQGDICEDQERDVDRKPCVEGKDRCFDEESCKVVE